MKIDYEQGKMFAEWTMGPLSVPPPLWQAVLVWCLIVGLIIVAAME